MVFIKLNDMTINVFSLYSKEESLLENLAYEEMDEIVCTADTYL